MTDLFETTIMCDKCHQETTKKTVEREGFPIRLAECPSCKKQWPHPLDVQDYENFKRLKQKQFEVKLRLVGNSYTVSIPREIIEFEEEWRKEMEKMDRFMRLALEEPDKLTLMFTRRMKRLL
jgi:NAD-dependent SIR2 family protein deacetylase